MTVGKKMLLLIFLACYCSLVSTDKEDKISSDEESITDIPETMEEFKPSHEWQSVKKGQPIPKGLHVRINLETGKTEAKLLTDPSSERKDVLSVYNDVSSDEGDEAEVDEHARTIRESLIKLESQERNVPNDLVDAVREKFRSYKELKETFKQLNMTVKTDLEIMYELVSKFKKLHKSKKTSDDELLLILTDLEYLVHQFDNALEFVKLEGVSDIVLPMLNCTQPTLRAGAAHLLGSAAQSNVKVQIAALENGAIGFLLKAVLLDSDPVVRIRSLYALSCLIRNFPTAQAKFVKEGGLSVLAKLFEKEQENHRLQIKVITLLHDLLLERQNAVKLLSETSLNKDELEMKISQYKTVGLEKTLLDHGWCSRIPQVLLAQDQNWSRTKKRDDLTSAVTDLPVRPEHDFVEKVADALLALVDTCHHDFNINSDLKKMINGLKLWYLELATKEGMNKHTKNIVESSEDDDSEGYLYYSGIAKTLESLTTELDKYNAKDEL